MAAPGALFYVTSHVKNTMRERKRMTQVYADQAGAV